MDSSMEQNMPQKQVNKARIIAWENVEFELNPRDIIEDDDSETVVYPEMPMKVRNALGLVDSSYYDVDLTEMNVWIGHTNFKLTKNDPQTISDVDGVEFLEIQSRYRIRVGIAKLFDTATVLSNIANSLKVEKPEPETEEKLLDAKIKHVAKKANDKYTFWFIYSNNGKNKSVGCDSQIEYKELVELYKSKPGFVYTYLGQTFKNQKANPQV